MNPYFRFRVTVLLFTLAAACSSHHKHTEHDAGNHHTAWPALDDFHTTMAKVFHPFMESNDLKPIKTHCQELINASARLMKSALPNGIDRVKANALMQQLNNDVLTVAAQVKQGNDENTGAALTKAHDDFHALMELAAH